MIRKTVLKIALGKVLVYIFFFLLPLLYNEKRENEIPLPALSKENAPERRVCFVSASPRFAGKIVCGGGGHFTRDDVNNGLKWRDFTLMSHSRVYTLTCAAGKRLAS